MHRFLRPPPFLLMLLALAAGVMLGHADPALGIAMKPLGDAFIFAIKLCVGPIVFCTVAGGVAGMRGLRRLGGLTVKAMICFELLSAAALLTGLAVAALLHPGRGLHIESAGIAAAVSPARTDTVPLAHLAHIAHAFGGANVLLVLLIALASGLLLLYAGERARPVTGAIAAVGALFNRLVRFVARFAPLAAFGAIAFTVGRYGVLAIGPLLALLGTLYLASALFIVLALGVLARLAGLRLWRLIGYVREELLVVIGTSASLSVLPQLMDKMERAGCSKSVVGLALATGYSFNLNGTKVYLAAALMFLLQALDIAPTPLQLLTALAVATLLSKSASGVAGSAFLTLSAIVAALPLLPLGSMALLIGIERLLKCRTLTNIIGNVVACAAIAAWAGELDREKMESALRGTG